MRYINAHVAPQQANGTSLPTKSQSTAESKYSVKYTKINLYTNIK